MKKNDCSKITYDGIAPDTAKTISETVTTLLRQHSPKQTWQIVSNSLLTSSMPFDLHLTLFNYCYPDWHTHPDSAPAWIPDKQSIQQTHLYHFMSELHIDTVKAFHAWTVQHYSEFMKYMLQKLNIVFHHPYNQISNLNQGIESPQWLSGAKLNIVESCFTAPSEKTALIFEDHHHTIQSMSYGELNRLSNRIANSLLQLNFIPGDAIAIDMPMTKEAVAIYLGIIKMGGIVVSIADSFSPQEIATRLRITQAKAIFCQDLILRGNKQLPLYEKIISADAPIAIVLSCKENSICKLREQDYAWRNFLVENDRFTAYSCDPMMPCNILFSSGTTGDPKAIPWNHTTAIKAASDAYLHQDIHSSDILAWPTNLGWMMGPWLIFAALINQASIALYDDTPRDEKFGQFIQDTKVTMLGVVPTLVAAWRQSNCMKGLNWQSIKCFSSTGECSNPEDMLYLMSLAGYKPVIEYCGGTEIGGSYITSTLIEDNCPSLFTTPTMGIDFTLLDESGHAAQNGEVALIPPSMGLSTTLLNADHYQLYFSNMPMLSNKPLRRHGDQAQQLANGYYSLLGRVDDTMNLGGIKISSAEIERVLAGIPDIIETAAIAISPPYNGPSQLVIYAATHDNLDKATVQKIMQHKINQQLNPLFKIHDIVFVSELPKTASNKIIRRALRSQYHLSGSH